MRWFQKLVAQVTGLRIPRKRSTESVSLGYDAVIRQLQAKIPSIYSHEEQSKLWFGVSLCSQCHGMSTVFAFTASKQRFTAGMPEAVCRAMVKFR